MCLLGSSSQTQLASQVTGCCSKLLECNDSRYGNERCSAREVCAGYPAGQAATGKLLAVTGCC
jgi:hypothetical protein